jgi:vancomycin resistance protein YoaR
VIKTRNTLLIFFLILIQSVIAITAGMTALLRSSLMVVPSGVIVGEQSIGGMDYAEAIKAVELNYAEKFKQRSLLIDVENRKKFEIPFSQIDARVDGDATIQTITSQKGIKGIPSLLNSYFGHTKPALEPVIKFNEGKLRMALLELSDKVYIAPTDASINYKNGILDRKAETSGLALNVTNTVEVIRDQLSSDPWGTVKLSREGGYELQMVNANVKLKDYDEIQQVLAEYSTRVIDKELLDGISYSIGIINGVTIPAAADGSKPEEFSFVKKIRNEKADFDNDNEGYDQVASTLYAALLSAGIPADSITRMPHKLAVDYIEPGLDAWISGSEGDLKFTNPFSHKIAIFAQLEGDRIKVAIAGSMSDKKGDYEIKTEITQRFEPPVYYIENRNLKPGEKVILNPGKEGVMVNVYRNGELIGPDKYEAEKAIVQIGPNTDWKNENK